MIKGSLLWNCLKAAVGAIPLNLMMSAVTLVICIVLGTLIAICFCVKPSVPFNASQICPAKAPAFSFNIFNLLLVKR